MTEIKRVLIAVDDDTAADLALGTGLACAADHQAEALVMGVLQNLDRWGARLSDILPLNDVRARYTEHRREQIERLVQSHGSNASVQVEVLAGVPFVEVIRKALAWSASLIVQATHPSTGSNTFFTSADWHLMRKSPIPVWIVKSPGYPPRHVAAAVELTDTEPHAEEFNRQIVELAAALASRAGAALSVFSAWHLPGEATLRNSPMLRVPADKLERALARARTEAEERQQALAGWLSQRCPLPPERLTWRLENGQPRDVIPAFTADQAVDLLVMGTVGRTGIPGLLIGNTAETILSRIKCSVITMKPSPFISPVA